ncbi:MAG: DNA repair protein RecO [Bacteroidetes bacterium]|nr:DNA repair protein RecO [Bacteroidota bacterium]
MLVRTQAIVLRTLRYRDTSGIISLYTREHGRLDCIAKGLHSKAGVRKFMPLQPGLRIEALVYLKPGRDLQLLTECSLRAPCYQVLNDPIRQIYLQLVLEIFVKAVQEHEPAPDLFALLDDSLAELDRPDGLLYPVFIAYLLELMRLLGFLPLPAEAVPPGWQIVLRVEAGMLEAVKQAPNAAGDWLQHLITLPSGQRRTTPIPKSVRAEILTELLAFFSHHLHTDFNNLKSLRIFEELFSA